MKRALVTALAALMLLAAAVPAMAPARPHHHHAGSQRAAATGPTGLTVSIGGPRRLKIARRVSFTYSCSDACNATVRTVLIMPGVVRSGQFSQPVQGGVVWSRYLTLPRDVRRYLRHHLRQSKLKVKVTAVPADGSTVPVVARNVFRFKK